jgi:nucleotide-binding universal stress UspA family protein
MFKRILVATDGSPTANRGLKVALAMAKEHVATLYVLHVIEDVAVAKGFDGGVYVPAQYVDSLLASLRDAGRRTLARAEKMALQYAQRVEPLLVQTLGESVAHTILTQARKHRVELIVLGTHGRRGLARLVMGSDAEAVIREALVPVLLVRSPKTTRVHRTTAKPAEAHRPAKRARRTVSARVVAAPEQPAGRVRAA